MSQHNQDCWLKVRNLRLRRHKKAILDDLDLDLRPGELTLLTGPNGVGKTTLLRVICGLEEPDHIQLQHQDAIHNWRKGRRILRQNICYLHQHPYLFDGSVYDNVAYGLKQKKLSRRQVDERVQEALEIVDLEHLSQRTSQQPITHLMTRIAIARAWVLSPAFMLLDEPVANLDKHSRQQCHRLINQLPGQNIGVLLTSHEPQQGELNFTRHLHMYGGKLKRKDRNEENVIRLQKHHAFSKKTPASNT